MKRLVCRKCGSSFFKFKQGDSSVQCFKCKNPIIINSISEEGIDKVKYISTSWKNIAE
ncbi:hypothetical protein R9X47_26085 [Wukongibacter baidiensis]|uniref:hypothetical protein n=1 Tax=Wukongibacter baidiensis TaxID=1723361 RepID=UPI003D7F955E